ncbi:MAG TPA: hypothetical protein VHF00_00495 [Acidimicrobiales bacterium]|nr:hypothetical protein [Acidimicrobiales bacterium]
MRWKDVCKVARRLPEVEDGVSYGTQGLRVRGAFVARLSEDGRSMSVNVGEERCAALCDARPQAFSPAPDKWMMIVRLPAVGPSEVWEVLLASWRRSAPASLVAAADPERGPQNG